MFALFIAFTRVILSAEHTLNKKRGEIPKKAERQAKMLTKDAKKKIFFDVILVLSLLLLALSAFFIYEFFIKDEHTPSYDAVVVIRVDNDVVYEEPLFKNGEYKVGNTNTVVVEGGRVRMESSTCPGYQDCVETGEIHLVGERIICLPNRVSVYIEDK